MTGAVTLFSLQAAAAMGEEGPETLDDLAALVEHSLIQVQVRSPDRRFRMLESVREYGNERLEAAGEAETIRERHAEWCAQFAEHADVQLAADGLVGRPGACP